MIIECPKCQTKYRVPDTIGTIRVNCKACGLVWQHPEIAEEASVAFMCSVTGKPYTVDVRRRSAISKFVIVRISKGPLVLDAASQLAATMQQLAGIIGSPAPAPSDHPFGWQDFDFVCPHCQPAPKQTHSYIHCGSCKKLTCDGGVETIFDGRSKFSCHCGASSLMGTGGIPGVPTQRRVAVTPTPQLTGPAAQLRLGR